MKPSDIAPHRLRWNSHIKKMCLVSIFAAVLTAPAADAVAAPDEVSGIPSITDGDSIRIGNLRIRIHGIDAPERRQLCQSAQGEERHCGQASTHALAALVGQRTVRCLKRDVDRYGRLVAQCFAGSTDLGAEQVRQGWAVAYRRYSRAYVAEEDQARRARRGIWAGEFQMPWDWRRQNRR